MKIWYDACTGKHVRYGVSIAQKLRESGHEILLTTRKHPDTTALLNLLGEKPKLVGEYSPDSAYYRLKASLKRQLAFTEMFRKEQPDFAVSHGSIELSRVAYGLKIPAISTADSPHATAANKLALSLVDLVITSKAIPIKEYRKFGVKKIVQFAGVDEVAWIKKTTPKSLNYASPLIVVRQMETKASYAEGKTDLTEEIAKKLSTLGNVMFISRYDKSPKTGLLVPQQFIDSVNLSANADLVVSVGGTISREAALQGTPSIVINMFGPSFVNDYLSKKGFPLFTANPNEVVKLAEKHIGKKKDVRRKLEKLESPVHCIEKNIETIL